MRHLDETLLKKVAKQFRAMVKRESFTLLDTSKPDKTAFEVVQRILRMKGIL